MSMKISRGVVVLFILGGKYITATACRNLQMTFTVWRKPDPTLFLSLSIISVEKQREKAKPSEQTWYTLVPEH